MKFRRLFAIGMLTIVGTMAALAQQMPPIPVDDAVRSGKLDNGLTYFIRYNNWPEHRANFYIAQKVGSIQEEESQRGLAHFLEHMAFNGSDNFKGNDLIRYCESIGVQFGGDLNAFTSIDRTVYNIDNVPTTRQESLDSCLLILRDWADGLTLDPEEIDKERGVIHEEWRLRTSAESRMFERNLPALYPGSKYGVRYPIGLMEVIDNFKPKELRDYYEKWYHPTNQGIIVVGDVDVDHTEAMIKKLFGPITNPENAQPVVDEQVPDTPEPIVIIDKDKEFRTSEVELVFKHEAYPDSMKGDMSYLIVEYLKNAAVGMLNQRFTEAAQKPECSYTNAYCADGNYIFAKTMDAFDISATPKDITKTADALKEAFIEARKAAEFGFTATEYERFKADYLSGLEKQYSNKDKRTNSQLYRQILGHFLDNEPMPSIDFTYQTMNQIVPMLPLQAVNMLMKEYIPANDSNMVVINFNNEAEGNVYPTKEQLLTAINEARAQEISAFVDNVKNEPLIAVMPKAGTIKKEVKNDKFGYTELTLSNGTTVILKQTDYKKDQVILSGNGLGGGNLYGEKDFANLMMFDDVIGHSGLGNFSSTELEKALAGKIANADLTMSGRYTSITGQSTPKDVETMLQMAYLYFTNINKDQAAYDQMMSSLEVQLKNRSLTPEVALSDTLTATMYGHNPRVAPMTAERLKDVSYDRILQIAKERTASAKGWTFYIIGNYDEETIRPLVCQYIGSLPAKGQVKKVARLTEIQKGDIDNTFKRKMETPKSIAYMIWTNEDMPYNLENAVKADIAGQVLSMVYLKKIREDASAAYSCGAQGNAQIEDEFHNILLLGYCPMKPEKKDVALQIMQDEVANMQNEIDPSMLDKVQKLMVKQYEDAQKTNNYWRNVILTSRKYGIDSHTDYQKVVEAQTTETIKQFMKEFLKPGNRIKVVMLPEEAE